MLDSMILHAISEETDQTWWMSRPQAYGEGGAGGCGGGEKQTGLLRGHW